MNMDLSDRTALVPGGSGGIGSHVADMLAECGAAMFALLASDSGSYITGQALSVSGGL
jgi:NAD(P)-dependent dehydrogenase (short-subunit alcohol dehydrogenase family)